MKRIIKTVMLIGVFVGGMAVSDGVKATSPKAAGQTFPVVIWDYWGTQVRDVVAAYEAAGYSLVDVDRQELNGPGGWNFVTVYFRAVN